MDNRALRQFATSENGAVTVDWVVLTAALVGLGLAVVAVTSGGVENLSNDTGQSLANTQISTSFASDEWTRGALLSWSEDSWDHAVSVFAANNTVAGSTYGANEALTHAENGMYDPAHQLDAAAPRLRRL